MNLLTEVRTRSELPAPPLARALREAAGVSQAAVAREVGVARMTVSRWESGHCKPTGDHLHRYAGLLRDLATATGGAR